jgi:hypothetical protein
MTRHRSSILCLVLVFAAAASAQSTYSNGALITHPGLGSGGADASALETGGTTLGSTAGPANFRLADDFTVPCNETWAINAFRVFAYQTNSTTTSTLTQVNYRIWSGQPGTAGAVILFDHSGANQLVSTTFTNIYRVTTTTLTVNTRPIFSADANGNAITLGPGTYWFDFQVVGSSALGGPFTPPVSGTATLPPAGNSVQAVAISGGGFIWQPALSGTVPAAVNVAMPFEIDYNQLAGPDCYSYVITQPTPGGAITITNAGGLPFHLYLNPITFNLGSFPNGWFHGVDIPLGELLGEVPLGAPFFGALDGAGGAVFVVPGGVLPPGLTFYTASAFYSGFGEIGHVNAFSFTTT